MEQKKTDDCNKDCSSHSGVVAKLEEHERRLDEMNDTIGKIFGKLDLISDRLMGRPGWVATTIITVLTTAGGIMLTIILKK